MTARPDDLVSVASGTPIEVQIWHECLREAGIDCRMVGDELVAGLGTALPGSTELLVHRADAERARKALERHETHHHQSRSHPADPHGHPVSDPKPDHSRGPSHGAPPHRPLPDR